MQASSPDDLHAPLAAASSTARLVDALWRALAYCLHPRVLLVSLLPLILTAAVLMGLAWWGWTDAVELVRAGLTRWSLSQTMLDWLDTVGAGGFRAVLAPLLVVLVAVPLVLVVCLLVVATWMTPAMVSLVAARRFPGLQALRGGGWWTSLAWSLGATLLALLALFATLPLWLIPPFALVLPPLIWGWLAYRVLSFDALAEHASPQERRLLLRRHRTALLAMGVVTGYLGAAPTAIWAFGALTVIFAPFLVVASVWLYTVVFAFSSLWFTHFLLAALQDLRRQAAAAGPMASSQEPSARSPFQVRPGDDPLVIDVPAREISAPSSSSPPPGPGSFS